MPEYHVTITNASDPRFYESECIEAPTIAQAERIAFAKWESYYKRLPTIETVCAECSEVLDEDTAVGNVCEDCANKEAR